MTLSPAGDLDGDGVGDALEVEGSILRGVDGLDGATSWERVFDGPVVPLLTIPLEPGGAGDVVVASSEERLVAGLRHRVTRVEGLAGTDGDARWSRRYEDVWTAQRFGDSAIQAAVSLTLPVRQDELAGQLDADGDRVGDLLIARYRFAEVLSTPAEAREIEATFQLLSGRTGGELHAFTAASDIELPVALLIPDLDGDGGADVVIAEAEAVEEDRALVRLRAIAGTTGEQRWEQLVEVPRGPDRKATPVITAVDIDGDARSDLVLATPDRGLLVLDGLDGRTLWSWEVTPGGGWYWAPAGDATGNGGQDLMVAAGGVTLLEGTSGAVVWWRPPGSGLTEIVGDGSGDGVRDVLVTGYSESAGQEFTTTRLISGKDGSTQFWERTRAGFLYHAETGDLDADGRADLLQFSFGDGVDDYMGLSGRTGKVLWAGAAVPPGDLTMLLTGPGIPGGTHLFESGADQDASYTAIRSGSTGELLWIRP